MTGNEGHPAWQEILSEIPEEYHAFIKPKLAAWDAGVQKKIEDTRAEFSDLQEFKFLVDNNINPEYVQQAVFLADQLQADPKKLVEQVNDAWKLGFIPEDAAPKAPPAGDGTEDNLLDLGDNEVDITKHPKWAEIQSKLDALETAHQTAQQAEEEAANLKEFEQYLDTLEASVKEKNLPFDKTFVTALIAQGVDGEDAVKQFHTLIASAGVQLPSEDNTQTQQPPKQDPPPVVMGSEGSTGGGLPDGAVDYGNLSANDLNSTIEQLLGQAQGSGQG